jgi:hypothetical protein
METKRTHYSKSVVQHDPTENNPQDDIELQRKMDHMIAAYNRANRDSLKNEANLSNEEIETLKSLGYLTNTKKRK